MLPRKRRHGENHFVCYSFEEYIDFFGPVPYILRHCFSPSHLCFLFVFPTMRRTGEKKRKEKSAIALLTESFNLMSHWCGEETEGARDFEMDSLGFVLHVSLPHMPPDIPLYAVDTFWLHILSHCQSLLPSFFSLQTGFDLPPPPHLLHHPLFRLCRQPADSWRKSRRNYLKSEEMTGSFCSRNFQRSALRVFCLVSRFWSLIRSLPLMESLIWVGEHHKQPRMLDDFFCNRQKKKKNTRRFSSLLWLICRHLIVHMWHIGSSCWEEKHGSAPLTRQVRQN